MEVVFVLVFVVFFVWSASKLGKTTAYVNPNATNEQLNEADSGLKAFWIALGVIVLFFFLSIGGLFTTGFDPERAKDNAGWVWSGEGSYRK